jgi:formate dehydrogenase (coenzyme F420) beta subunit
MVHQENSYYSKSINDDLSQKGECGGVVSSVIKYLLENKLIDAALVLKKGTDIYDAVPVLIDDPDELIDTAGSLHCGTINMAGIIVKYLNGAEDMKLAVTTKPCDTVAIKELIKLDQIKKDNIILLGLNCGGTLPPVPIRECINNLYNMDADAVLNLEVLKGKLIINSSENEKAIYIKELEDSGYGRRLNCQRCPTNIPQFSDLAFGNWGVEGSKKGKITFVEVITNKGKEILKKAFQEGYITLDAPSTEGLKIRKNLDKHMSYLAHKKQELSFDNSNKDIISFISNISDEFNKCIKCMGCREACPICFCNECTLETSILQCIDRGKIPPSLLFHLERLIHMVEYCTNCGQCEDVCPMDIPLSKIWHQTSLRINRLQKSAELSLNDILLIELFKRPD